MTDEALRTFCIQGLGFGLPALIVGDRDDGRLVARVPGSVCGADLNRIVAAIPIIAPARGLQLNGEGIAAVRSGVKLPLGWTWPYSSIT